MREVTDVPLFIHELFHPLVPAEDWFVYPEWQDGKNGAVNKQPLNDYRMQGLPPRKGPR